MFNIGVLASTNGTDLQAIIDEIKAGKMKGINLSVVIGNKKNAFALKRAKDQGYKAIFVNPKNRSREEFDVKLVELFKKYDVDLVVLIGYMRILTPLFVKAFNRKIINVHPALIPKFSGPGFFGKNVHEAVLKSGEKETGCTIHFVEDKVDGGEIIVQESVKVYNDDTPDSLKKRVQNLEKRLYPEVIRRFARGEIV